MSAREQAGKLADGALRLWIGYWSQQVSPGIVAGLLLGRAAELARNAGVSREDFGAYARDAWLGLENEVRDVG